MRSYTKKWFTINLEENNAISVIYFLILLAKRNIKLFVIFIFLAF